MIQQNGGITTTITTTAVTTITTITTSTEVELQLPGRRGMLNLLPLQLSLLLFLLRRTLNPPLLARWVLDVSWTFAGSKIFRFQDDNWLLLFFCFVDDRTIIHRLEKIRITNELSSSPSSLCVIATVHPAKHYPPRFRPLM